MAKAIDVADFIIMESKKMDHPITNLELQKYMFFCNARHLLENESTPLIHDELLEKWKYGPVSPTAYHTYKRYGIEPIQAPDTHTSLNTETWEIEIDKFSLENLTAEERALISDTIPQLFEYGRFDLVEETHKHPSWKREEEAIMNGKQGLQYTNIEISEDFQSKPEFQIWNNN